jgi:hypothetical protein
MADGSMNHLTIHHADGDAVALLRSIADAIETRAPVEVFDITFSFHWDVPDQVAEATVYYSAEPERPDGAFPEPH